MHFIKVFYIYRLHKSILYIGYLGCGQGIGFIFFVCARVFSGQVQKVSSGRRLSMCVYVFIKVF